MPVTVKKAIEDYLVSDGFRQWARTTQDAHRRATALLLDICGPRMIVPRLTRIEIDRTIDIARDRLRALGPVKEYSLNTYRAGLKGLVKFCHSAGYLPGHNNPTAHLKTAPWVRNPRKRKPLTEEQTLQLIELAGERHPMERIAVVILAFTGMRESELAELRLRDIQWEQEQIVFYRPKAKDWHTASFTPELEYELRVWLGWYRERYPEMRGEWRVVPARSPGHATGVKMHPDWPIRPTHRLHFWPIFKSLLREVGVTDLEGKGPHTMRRTFAEMVLALTGNIRAVQESLGHRFLSTTESYLDINTQREKNRKDFKGWRLGIGGATPENVIPLRRAG